jgi:ubiquitin-conjugating enzyme E2 T
MSSNKMLISRLQKEMARLVGDPAPGVSVWLCDPQELTELQAQLIGPEGTPYSSGVFNLSISIPSRYPFEPPRVRFSTPLYHPNIDSDGRICLDTLKMQPQGSWSPASNIYSVLLSIRLLLAHPNAEDGLVPDITDLYKKNISEFNRIAEQHTLKWANQNQFVHESRISALEVKESTSPKRIIKVEAQVASLSAIDEKEGISQKLGEKRKLV